MSAAPDVYVGPAFIGWRSWRILPFERLGERASVRLCASGTMGTPKVWEPRLATRAVCGKFRTTHESPWPDCECGLYAYRTREDAETHLETFREGNADNVLGWAFGRVSLWGRIVECEYGWRAEYAYPYAIDVHAEPDVAAEVRRLYGVDVEQHPPFPPIKPPVEEVKQFSDRLAQIADELEELTGLAGIEGTLRAGMPHAAETWKTEAARREKRWKELRRRVADLPPLAPLEASDDEVLVAMLAAIAIERENPYPYGSRMRKPRHAAAVSLAEITAALLMLRGEKGDPDTHGVRYWCRRGYDASEREIRKVLNRLTADGLLASGKPVGRNYHWRITPSGRAHLSKIGWPREIAVPATAVDADDYLDASIDDVLELRETVVSVVGSFRSLSYPPSPFVKEIAASQETWREERQAAQAKPRQAYLEWLTAIREECVRLDLAGWSRLAFTDDDVLAALRVVSADEFVPFAVLRDRLVPGRPNGRTISSESAGLSQALVRLRKRGLADQRGKQQGAWLWSAVTRTEEALGDA